MQCANKNYWEFTRNRLGTQVQWSYKVAYQTTIGMTPFNIMFGKFYPIIPYSNSTSGKGSRVEKS